MHTSKLVRLAVFAVVGLLCVGRALGDTALLDRIERTVRADPFIEVFQNSMGYAFGCDPEQGFQEVSVYTSLYSSLGPEEAKSRDADYPNVHIEIYCHSSGVSRVFINLEVYRGSVRALEDFDKIEPLMIQGIRFEMSDSFGWWITSEVPDSADSMSLPAAAVGSPIWKLFATQVDGMFPHGCKPLSMEGVFEKENEQNAFHGLPYIRFTSVLSCPKPGPLKPGFRYRGWFFPTKGFVLPVAIESAGAYVD